MWRTTWRASLQTSIAGFVGDDYHCKSLLEKFHKRGIACEGLIKTDRPTTTKLRIIGGHQQMLRLDFEESAPITGDDAVRFLDYIQQKLQEGLDCLIISDYGKGVCTKENCQAIMLPARRTTCLSSSIRKGRNWMKYAGADYDHAETSRKSTPVLTDLSAMKTRPSSKQPAL